MREKKCTIYRPILGGFLLNSKGVTPDSTLNSTPSHRTQTEPSPETFSKPKESPEPQPEPELPKRGRPKAKRSDPNFTQISAYIRKETHRKVKMKLLEIESDQDLSELVEQLLQGWLSESS